MDHQWVEDPKDGHEYCSKCGLFEWLARLGSICSGIWGQADEANQ